MRNRTCPRALSISDWSGQQEEGESSIVSSWCRLNFSRHQLLETCEDREKAWCCWQHELSSECIFSVCKKLEFSNVSYLYERDY